MIHLGRYQNDRKAKFSLILLLHKAKETSYIFSRYEINSKNLIRNNNLLVWLIPFFQIEVIAVEIT